MTITNEAELDGLKAIGRIVANTLEIMGRALAPGMTTAELDAIGARALAAAGARSAPSLAYGFPGATCISVFPEIAHGIPGDRVIAAGDLVNIDVSAEKDGFYADTGASFVAGGATADAAKLLRDGRRAMWAGIGVAAPGAPLARIGDAIGAFARKNRYTLIRNLASHGVGRSLHEEPTEIPTWPDRSERRKIGAGQVFTVEPFLSRGAEWAENVEGDPWALVADTADATVQFELTIVATPRGPIIITLPG